VEKKKMRIPIKVVSKSIGKALRDVGITVGTVAALAGLTVLAEPATLAPIVAAVPGPVGMVVLLVVPIAVKAAQDAIKHRDD
jgi:hypothetical protein